MQLAVVLVCLQQSLALASPGSAEALKRLSLEELMNVEVTTVSRTVERLGGAAAAITVVTNERIRRSGATTIPEALRGVPGLHVARRSSSSWAVSSRGFSSVNSEKLLVLNDTRSLYTPLLSGVAWDVQDYILQDIARIEVIRGPGAALWGSNAVNGIINIITKHSRDTQGLYLETGIGTEEEALAAARYGGTLRNGATFRVFGRYSERDGTHHPANPRDDPWNIGHVGLRADWDSSEQDAFMLQAAAYDGEVDLLAPSVVVIGRPEPTGRLRTDVSGGNVMGRWSRTGKRSHWRVRAYYDTTHRDDPSFEDHLDTLDLDVQHGLRIGSHDVLWGLNYRYTENDNDGKGVFALVPSTSRDRVISGFVQDQARLTPAVQLTVGTKIEENEFSELEVQPSIRVGWELQPEHALWAAISRAVRVPTRLERDIAVDASDPTADTVLRLSGNPDFDSEELLAHEIGYRWQASDALYVDVAAFYNDYDGLASLEFGTPFVNSEGRTIIPVLHENLTDGSGKGIELLLSLTPVPYWRLTATYSYIDLDLDPRGEDLNRGITYEDATPKHQIGLRSFLDLPHGMQLDAYLRYVSEIERGPDIVSGVGIDSYTELDLRFAWQLTEELELSLVGQNLLHGEHAEFGDFSARGEIERSIYAKLAWGF